MTTPTVAEALAYADYIATKAISWNLADPRVLVLAAELRAARVTVEKQREALEAVKKWRDGPEGPEVLFQDGATMLQLVNLALTPDASTKMP